MARAMLLVLLALLAGCLGDSSGPGKAPVADAPDPWTEAVWTMGDCQHLLFNVLRPVSELQPLLPPRHHAFQTIYPGFGLAMVNILRCPQVVLDTGVVFNDIEQATLAIAVGAGTSYDEFLLDWSVSDPSFAAELAQVGFQATAGTILDEASPVVGFETTTVQGDAEKATLLWSGEPSIAPKDADRRWLQSRDDEDVVVTIDVPFAYFSRLTRENCVLEAVPDPLWRAALGPGPECTAYLVEGPFQFLIENPDL